VPPSDHGPTSAPKYFAVGVNRGHMPDLKRGLRALSKPLRHATALLRIARTFRNWTCQAYRYALRRSAQHACEAVFRSDESKLFLAGYADLSNLWAIFGREEYPVFADDQRIVDIGANVGLFSVFAARRATHVHITAIEPVEATFAALSRNVRESDVDGKVSLLNAAVASSDRRQRIYLGTSSDLASLYPNVSGQTSEWIEAKGINCILRDHEGPISLLKMDCEGAEWEILAAAQRDQFQKVQRLYVEYHALTPAKMHTALEDLARLGFQPQMIQKHGAGNTAVVWANRTEKGGAIPFARN
jgi:FkbM family methyltransferase